MSEVFLKIVNMSISASWIVLAVLVLRVILKRAPKWTTVLLWGIVGIRLTFPFSIESVMSIIPSAEVISPDIMLDREPEINIGIPVINNAINPIISESFTPSLGASANPLQIWIPILAFVWIVGMLILLIYTAISYWRVCKRVDTAILLCDNIYQSENIVSPFVLGMVKPKIYLPFDMKEQEKEHVIAHEQAHIRRRDNLWKPFGFLLLTIHWFNPLIWLAYIMFSRDIELACDEKVIKELNVEQRADYSQALLNCSVNHRVIAACPLAFGEVGVKARVKSVLGYKKPAFWFIVAAVIVIIITSLCLLTNPQSKDIKDLNERLQVFLDMQVAKHNESEKTKDNFIAVSYDLMKVDESRSEISVYMWVLYMEYSCDHGGLEVEAGSHVPVVITAKKDSDDYELVEYWEPRDGNLFASDIKEKFPMNLWLKALDSQRTIDKQNAECEQMAKEYFKKKGLFVSGASGDTWGISMDLLFQSASEMDVVITHSSKDAKASGTLTASSAYELRVLYEGKSISFARYMQSLGYDYAEPEVVGGYTLHEIETDGTLVMKENLKAIYGELPMGSYLYCKPITLTMDDGQEITKIYRATFAVVDE